MGAKQAVGNLIEYTKQVSFSGKLLDATLFVSPEVQRVFLGKRLWRKQDMLQLIQAVFMGREELKYEIGRITEVHGCRGCLAILAARGYLARRRSYGHAELETREAEGWLHRRSGSDLGSVNTWIEAYDGVYGCLLVTVPLRKLVKTKLKKSFLLVPAHTIDLSFNDDILKTVLTATIPSTMELTVFRPP